MKKRTLVITILCAVLAMALCLCACGAKKDDGKEKTSPAETTKPVETTAPAETTMPAAQVTSEMMEAAHALIDNLNTTTTLDCVALSKDTDIVYTSPDGYTYYKVTDLNFQNFGDISKLLDDTFTVDCAKAKFPALADPSSVSVPIYLYVQGKDVPDGLYQSSGGKGGFYYDPNREMTFENVKEDSFTASLPYDYFEEQRIITIDFVKVDGKWKISNFDPHIN